MTPRAVETLRQLTHIFAEDTRELKKLMELSGVLIEGKKLHSYASHNLKQATELAMELLASGNDVGLTTDRGMPGISDPGALMVQAARKQKCRVFPIPGPSAVTTLMSVSGFTDNGFLFAGFFPKEKKDQEKLFETAEKIDLPVVIFESPHRAQETLQLLSTRFAEGTVLIGREMTKAFEEYVELSLEEAGEWKGETRGEFTIAFRVKSKPVSQETLEEVVADKAAADKDWSKRMAKKHGWSATEIYNALQATRRK